MSVYYEKSEEVWKDFPGYLTAEIEQAGHKKICDIGGGAHPMLSHAYVAEQNLEYTVLDISEEELSGTQSYYHTIVADIASDHPDLPASYDFVFSKMLAEHVPNGENFHRNIFNMLRKGGVALHFFPTLYCLPFVVNKLLDEKMSTVLFNTLAPENRKIQKKFPAHYQWCTGPTRKNLKRLTSVGFEIVSYTGLFGHKYYQKVPPLQKCNDAFSTFLVKHPTPFFTSYALVILRKPL